MKEEKQLNEYKSEELTKVLHSEIFKVIDDLNVKESVLGFTVTRFEIAVVDEKVLLYSTLALDGKPKELYELPTGESYQQHLEEIKEEIYTQYYNLLLLLEGFTEKYTKQLEGLYKTYKEQTPIFYERLKTEEIFNIKAEVRLKLTSKGVLGVNYARLRNSATFSKVSMKASNLYDETIYTKTDKEIDDSIDKVIYYNVQAIDDLINYHIAVNLNDFEAEMNYKEEGFKTYVIYRHKKNKIILKRMGTEYADEKNDIQNDELKFKVGIFVKYKLITDKKFYEAFKLKYVTLYKEFEQDIVPFVLGIYNHFQLDTTGKLHQIDYESKKLPSYVKETTLRNLHKSITDSFKACNYFSNFGKFTDEPMNRFLHAERKKYVFMSSNGIKTTIYTMKIRNQFKTEIVDTYSFRNTLYFDENFTRINNNSFKDIQKTQELYTLDKVDSTGGTK